MVPISRAETGLNIPNYPEQYRQYQHHQDLLDLLGQNNNNKNQFIYPNTVNPLSSNSSFSDDDYDDQNEELEENISPKTHPFARTNSNKTKRNKQQMNNMDPTNEFMYQIPLNGFNNKSMSEGGFGLSERGSQPLDLKALNERLQTLGLGGPSIDSLGTSLPHQPPPPTTATVPQPLGGVHGLIPQAPSQSALSPNQSEYQLGSGFQSNHFLSPITNTNDPQIQFQQPIQAYPSITELAPGDSISMYRPARAPSTSARSQRRGGTNVDPGETGDNTQFTPPPEEAYENAPGDNASYWSQDDITARTPRTGAGGLDDEMTVAPTSVWTRGDMGRDMYDHRDRLLRQESSRNAENMEEIQRQIREVRNLATTTTKLESTEKQLRELQARLIAEQVARTQIEKESNLKEEEMKNYQNEWASAVRALRRARDEGKKSDEEKRRIQRCFEEARDKLWKYHEALRVREARAQGKEEGRAEAWQEAERWMGSSPPIPGIEPLQAVPGAVLHQTPMMQVQTPMFLQSPTKQYFQQQAQQPQQYQQPPQPQQQLQQQQQQIPQQPQPQWQQPQASSPGPNAPMQSIAQLMEYFAQNPGAFPQFQQGQGQQQITPPQNAPQPHTQQQMPMHMSPSAQQIPQQTANAPQQQMQTMQTPGQSIAPMSQQTPGQTAPTVIPQQTGMHSQYTGAAAQYMHPQSNGQPMMPQHTGQQSMAPMMPQHTGPPMMQPQHTGAPAAKQVTPPQPAAMAQPMMVPVMVPMAQATPIVIPQTIPVSVSQLPPNPTQQTHSTIPAYTQPTIPPQPPTLTQRTPRAPTTAVHTTPGKNNQPTSTRTQATRLPPANRTGISTVPQVPHPESVAQPHAAESYLERVEHDPSLKKMMGGARSKTIHTSAVPQSTTEYSKAPTQPQPHTAARSTFDDGSSNIDKPLPNPFPPSQVLGLNRSQTHRTPSTIRQQNQSANNTGNKMSRRMSLSDGLHNSHAIRMSQIPDGDRYPAFPIGGNNHQHQGKTHSRNTSYGSIDPAGIGLPLSRDVSNVQSPNSEYRAPRSSVRQTPNRSGRTSARSRVAGALRNDMDLESELPGIEEAEEEEMYRQSQGQIPPPMMQHQGQMPPNGMPPPHMMRQMQSQNGRGAPFRAPPSMPNMRHRINPVMPQPLGGGPPPLGGPNKTFSEPHATRIDKGQGHKTQHSLSALFQHRDAAGQRSEHLPEPESAYHPPRTHEIFVPPGLAPAAVSGGVEDVQGPRTSALGLSGLSQVNGGGDEGRMRAPTITVQPPSSRSRSNNPASAYYPHSPKTPQPAPAPQSPTRTEITHKGGRQPINLDSPPAPGTTRQTVIITERTNPRPDTEAHQVPLPKSKSNAPTAYSGMSPEQIQDPRDIPLPPTKTHDPSIYSHMGKEFDVIGREPYQIPLPKSIAPTAFTTTQAQKVPLPNSISNAPTAYTSAQHQQQQKEPFQFPLPPSKSTAPTAYTAMNYNNGGNQEPHRVPLPPPRSIAPTAYTISPPELPRAIGPVPEVRSIDFANFPLPRGGGTVYDMRTQVTSEPDIDEPKGPARSQTHKTPPPPSKSTSTKKSYRKPVPSNGNGNGHGNGHVNGNGNGNSIEPRMYPLPPSRAPTRGNRASTYAASVPPIEEVTEPESGRENTLGRQSRVY